MQRTRTVREFDMGMYALRERLADADARLTHDRRSRQQLLGGGGEGTRACVGLYVTVQE